MNKSLLSAERARELFKCDPAGISVNKARNSLGCFETPEDAHKTYLVAKRRLHADRSI